MHGQRRSSGGKPIPCPCRRVHADDDPPLGVPVDPDSYDYRRAAWDAVHFARLLDRYWLNLPAARSPRPALARAAGDAAFGPVRELAALRHPAEEGARQAPAGQLQGPGPPEGHPRPRRAPGPGLRDWSGKTPRRPPRRRQGVGPRPCSASPPTTNTTTRPTPRRANQPRSPGSWRGRATPTCNPSNTDSCAASPNASNGATRSIKHENGPPPAHPEMLRQPRRQHDRKEECDDHEDCGSRTSPGTWAYPSRRCTSSASGSTGRHRWFRTSRHPDGHFYGSALLDAGESIKALAEYLGHSDPVFTLRAYTHLMPPSEKRARRAIDDLSRRPRKARTSWGRPEWPQPASFRSSAAMRRGEPGVRVVRRV